MGYARLDQQLRKDTQADQPLGRHILWKEARVNKDGVVDNENVKKVVELCEIIEQSSENPEGNKDTCRDILGKVFNVPEYSGRVRGKGFGVTPKSFFPQEKRQKASNEEFESVLKLRISVWKPHSPVRLLIMLFVEKDVLTTCMSGIRSCWYEITRKVL
ncbi:uncharacterized protein [Cicer arietinum]|uniref:uncharacterized protein n=1 Tax=Cicer arietinum TaxID=3827 RepID=UPI003CC55871